MNLDMDIINASSLVIVPIIIGIVQAIKLTGFLKDGWTPLVAIALGMVIGWLANHDNADLSATLLSGCVYGLMACGLYSTVKVSMIAAMRAKEKRAKEEAEKHRDCDPI